jgi:hypothetical protein
MDLAGPVQTCDLALQVVMVVTLLAALVSVANAFRMMRLPDPARTSAAESTALG